MYIGGQWVDARSGETFESVDPFTGRSWALVPRAGTADVDDAVDAARRAFDDGLWRRTTAVQRGRLMRRLASLIGERAREVAIVESTDNGKLLREMEQQLAGLPDYYEYFAGAADKLHGDTIPSDRSNFFIYTVREPVGVVGAITPWNSPVLLMTWKLAPALAAGWFHDLALLSNGTIMAWGSGSSGQLGDGSFNDETTPVPVSGVSNAIGIAAGTFFSLALLRDGTVVGFGSNQYNQLGSAATTNYDTPIPVSGVSGATQITAGDYFSAAVVSNGTALAWGANAHPALGNGTVGATFSTVATPAPVVGVSGAMAISAGGYHTLALTSSGAVVPPPPVFAKSVDVTPVSGVVLIKLLPGTTLAGQLAPALAAPAAGQGFVPLTQARQIPTGSQLDTTDGVVALTSAATPGGKIQSGRFRSGLFQVPQTPSQKGLTNLRLIDDSRVCKTAGRKASIAGAPTLSKRVIDLLRAKVKGKFRTSGRYAAATVRGTAWDMIDRCDGTLTVVHRGVVSVHDLRLRKTVTVGAGHSYLAKAG